MYSPSNQKLDLLAINEYFYLISYIKIYIKMHKILQLNFDIIACKPLYLDSFYIK